ncbi:hypothetical protein H4R18_004749 [Coemansia javaensis]|uniref:Betaine lipid synthase n=1 Tax=Coemansia javaensis TaxID=2761396 RepID=A0A9W8H5A9_9FUNG|nr:hypothetical protein H4R18_004749 [Coemansia javaensis]
MGCVDHALLALAAAALAVHAHAEGVEVHDGRPRAAASPAAASTYAVAAVLGAVALAACSRRARTAAAFAYNCFLRPLGAHASDQKRLDAFYEGQAGIYDATRSSLLRGRRTMLRLCAAELERRAARAEKLVWVDMGGGTGWNIEQMDAYFDVSRFHRIYLVDLCRPLCQVAARRAKANGWSNVHIVCQDAASFALPADAAAHADLVTMSYSLSMIGDYYAAIDHVSRLLRPRTGVVGVVDFYVSDPSRTDCGAGTLGYRCSWLTRVFWQHWFEQDHVHLHPSRRNYLEHAFATLKVLNARNHFVVPYLVQIPYYVWLGSPSPAAAERPLDAARFELPSPSASPRDCLHPRSAPSGCPDTWSQSSAEAADSGCLYGVAAGAPARGWARHPYRPSRPEHAQFSTYIYGFTWEDPRTDICVLDLQRGDTVLAITSAGDNVLAYAAHTEGLTIHCVDMNPCQNHLLELKLAALHALDYGRFWSMFGAGQLPGFGRTLDTELSALLSSAAYQYWRANTSAFASAGELPLGARLLGRRGLYTTGYSGLALRCLGLATRLLGVHDSLREMAAAPLLKDQAQVWRRRVLRRLLGSAAVLLLDNRVAMWQLMGVPASQWNMLRSEGSMSQYIRDTLDPVATTTSFARDNYFYHMLIAHRYSRACCPDYLTEPGFRRLQRAARGAAGTAFSIHTATISDTLRSMRPGELSKAVVMDHMDWFGPDEAEAEVRALRRALKQGGFVLWRSAARIPWYIANFEANGFRVEALAVRQPNTQAVLDRVNMYASFYKATKL